MLMTSVNDLQLDEVPILDNAVAVVETKVTAIFVKVADGIGGWGRSREGGGGKKCEGYESKHDEKLKAYEVAN